MRLANRPAHCCRRVRVSVACAIVVVLTAACGGSGAPSSGGGLEKSRIKVGVMPIVATAPFFLAKEKGYFKDEGLTVEAVTIAGGAEGIPKLVGGDIAFTYSNYVSLFQAMSKGIELRVAADGYNAADNTLTIMAMPESGIRKPRDLAGKTIAVNTLGNQAVLTTKSVLDTHGVETENVKFVAMPFPDVPAALEKGSVDAGYLVEPFITQSETELGAQVVVDIGTGATKGWPTAGYATTADFYEKYPKTAAAFAKAMRRGAKAAHRRASVEKIVPTYTKISAETMAIINMGEFPTTVNEERMQRVADLMHKYGLLKKKLDAARLLPPASM